MNKKLLISLCCVLVAVVLLVTCIAAAYLTGDNKSYISVVKSGYRYLEAGDYENAILMFDQARKMDNTRMEAYYGLYQTYVRSGQNQNALAALNSGVMATNDAQLLSLLQQVQSSNGEIPNMGETPTSPNGGNTIGQVDNNNNPQNPSYVYAAINTSLLDVITRANYSDYLIRYGYATGVMRGDEFSVHLRDLGATLIYKIDNNGTVIDPATNAPRDTLMPDKVVMDDVTALFGGTTLSFADLQYMKGIQYPHISGSTITFMYLDCKVTITCDQNTRITPESPNYLEPNKSNEGEGTAQRYALRVLVKDAETQAPLAGAQVGVYETSGLNLGSLISQGTTDSTGYYSCDVPGTGAYCVTATMDGYVEDVVIVEVTAVNMMPDASILLEPEADPGVLQALTLTVIDATNTQPVSGAEVKLVNPDGNVVIGIGNTDASGKISFDAYGGITYKAEVKKAGYIDDTFDIQVLEGVSNTEQTVQISPVMQADEIRLVLTWDENPRDLDSHLQGTSPSGSNVHVYFSNKINRDSNGDKIAELDVDDTSSYGPETTTIYQTNGNYEFLVHRYSGVGTISESNAVVKIYVGNTLYATVEVAEGVEELWHVCTIVDGRITVTNRNN